MNSENITRRTLDPNNLPPLTAKQIALLARLDAMTDEEIDLSDAPEHDFEKMPMHRVNPGAGPKGRETEETEKETAGV